MTRRSAVPLALLLLAAGCRSAAPPPRAAVPAPPPDATARSPMGGPEKAADPILALRWVRDAAEYEASLRQVYRLATAQVERAAAGKTAGTWGVILDADETIISNLTYQAERTAIGKGYSSDSWTAWVKRKQATPLPGAGEFLARVRALGGKIAIVTNRRAAVCPETEETLRAGSLVYDAILCRTDEENKNPRFEAVRRGTLPSTLPPLAIVAYVGDNIQDFPDLTQDVKTKGAAGFAEFGSMYFVLPNPLYGSWEPK